MAGDYDEQSNLFTRVGAIGERFGALESIMDSMAQEIKMLSLNFDDRSLVDGAF